MSSVCPSVTLVDHDHKGCKSWKLSAPTISPTPSLFVAQRPPPIFPGEHKEILGRLEVGWGKLVCWSTKAAISLKRVEMEEKLLWWAYRNSPTLYRTVPSPTSSSPRLGVCNPTQNSNRYYPRNGQSYELCTHVPSINQKKFKAH